MLYGKEYAGFMKSSPWGSGSEQSPYLFNSKFD